MNARTALIQNRSFGSCGSISVIACESYFGIFPQNSVHPHASAAAQAAEAAGAQGKFWEMHRALFEHQRELAELDLTHLALSLGLDPYRFGRDSESEVFAQTVRDHHHGGIQSGVKGTPTFFINGARHHGAINLGTLILQLEAAAAESLNRREGHDAD